MKKNDNYLICVPSDFPSQLLDWYHQNLKHPDIGRRSLTIRQYFDYHNIQKYIHDIVRTYDAYQRNKMTATKNYGKLLVTKLNLTTPWATVHTYRIVPKKVRFHLWKT